MELYENITNFDKFPIVIMAGKKLNPDVRRVLTKIGLPGYTSSGLSFGNFDGEYLPKIKDWSWLDDWSDHKIIFSLRIEEFYVIGSTFYEAPVFLKPHDSNIYTITENNPNEVIISTNLENLLMLLDSYDSMVKAASKTATLNVRDDPAVRLSDMNLFKKSYLSIEKKPIDENNYWKLMIDEWEIREHPTYYPVQKKLDLANKVISNWVQEVLNGDFTYPYTGHITAFEEDVYSELVYEKIKKSEVLSFSLNYYIALVNVLKELNLLAKYSPVIGFPLKETVSFTRWHKKNSIEQEMCIHEPPSLYILNREDKLLKRQRDSYESSIEAIDQRFSLNNYETIYNCFRNDVFSDQYIRSITIEYYPDSFLPSTSG